MTITAELIARSSCEDHEIATLQLRYPKFIHAEFMTHRVFSRNASSSRAIPVSRLIEDIKRDTAMPIHWGKNQSGMQAREECTNEIKWQEYSDDRHGPNTCGAYRIDAWLKARDNAIKMAQAFHEAGYHKQIVNRLLEPFSHINVVVTSTEWDNFFALRDHEDAQPEIRELAQAMRKALKSRDPVDLKFGDWHLPYCGEATMGGAAVLRTSVARCARVSYLTHDRKPSTVEEDVALFDRLTSCVPAHVSPLEHQATPDPQGMYRRQWGNFSYWRQYRKIWGL